MSENDLHQVASHTAHVNMNHAMSKTYSHINEHMLLQPSPQMRRISPHAFQVEGKQPSGPRETGVPAVVAAETTQKKKKRRTKAPWKTRYWSTTTRRKKTVCNVFIAHQFAQAYKCTRPKASATHTHTHTHARTFAYATHIHIHRPSSKSGYRGPPPQTPHMPLGHQRQNRSPHRIPIHPTRQHPTPSTTAQQPYIHKTHSPINNTRTHP